MHKAPRIIGPEGATVNRVLVVDDQPAVRELVRAVLTSAGYAVDEARDGPRRSRG
jgi:CheY-like chemotaxis protein